MWDWMGEWMDTPQTVMTTRAPAVLTKKAWCNEMYGISCDIFVSFLFSWQVKEADQQESFLLPFFAPAPQVDGPQVKEAYSQVLPFLHLGVILHFSAHALTSGQLIVIFGQLEVMTLVTSGKAYKIICVLRALKRPNSELLKEDQMGQTGPRVDT